MVQVPTGPYLWPSRDMPSRVVPLCRVALAPNIPRLWLQPSHDDAMSISTSVCRIPKTREPVIRLINYWAQSLLLSATEMDCKGAGCDQPHLIHTSQLLGSSIASALTSAGTLKSPNSGIQTTGRWCLLWRRQGRLYLAIFWTNWYIQLRTFRAYLYILFYIIFPVILQI